MSRSVRFGVITVMVTVLLGLIGAHALAGNDNSPDDRSPLPGMPSVKPLPAQEEVCPPVIDFGETIQCSIDSLGEIDTYTFDGAINDRILVRMAETVSFLFEAEVRVIRPDGTTHTLCTASSNTLAETECVLDDTGPHKILAGDPDGDGTGAYSLFLQRLNNPGKVIPINFGDTLSGTIALSAQIDTYTFDGAINDRILVRMAETVSFLFEAEVRVIRPDGTTHTLCTASSNTLAEVECVLDDNGTHAILAGEPEGDGTGAYSLFLQRLNNPGKVIPINFGDTLGGTIALSAQIDTYTFDGAINDRILVRMAETVSSLFEAEVRVIRPDGTTLSDGTTLCTDSSNTLAEVECVLDDNGTHAILAGEPEGDGTGDYSLTLICLNPPCGEAPAAEVDLSLAKNDLPDPVAIGSELTYILTVTNENTETGLAISVVVTDTLPAGVTFKSSTASQGTVNPPAGADVVWDVGDLSQGQSETVDIVVTVDSTTLDGTILTNTAVVVGDQDDPIPDNNTAEEQTTAVLPVCTLVLSPSYAAGTLTVDVLVGTNVAATGNLWLTSDNGIVSLFSGPLAVTEPPINATITTPLAPSGTVGTLATLTLPGLGLICSDFNTVDTGLP